MKVLLHVCCGPCLIYPLEVLSQEGLELESYFYNPNIQPEDEFEKRKSACLSLADSLRHKINLSDYKEEDFCNAITDKNKPGRCLACWNLRLLKTAEFAKENNFGSFTTTLLASPYQDIEALRVIGERIARFVGVAFLYRDFRGGFKAAHSQAKAAGIYCQRYCGCLYSKGRR